MLMIHDSWVSLSSPFQPHPRQEITYFCRPSFWQSREWTDRFPTSWDERPAAGHLLRPSFSHFLFQPSNAICFADPSLPFCLQNTGSTIENPTEAQGPSASTCETAKSESKWPKRPHLQQLGDDHDARMASVHHPAIRKPTTKRRTGGNQRCGHSGFKSPIKVAAVWWQFKQNPARVVPFEVTPKNWGRKPIRPGLALMKRNCCSKPNCIKTSGTFQR